MKTSATATAVRPIDDAEKAPYDASNPEHVRTARKKAEIRQDLIREGLRFIMSDRRGRAWMRHLLVDKLHEPMGSAVTKDVNTGNSYVYYNTAHVELARVLKREAYALCRAEFRLMEDEGEEPNA